MNPSTRLTPAVPDGRRAFGPAGVRAIALVWLAVVIAGVALVWRHAMTPGPSAAAASVIAPSADHRFRLTVVVNPMCPCSRATVGELERIVTTCGGRLTARVIFMGDPSKSDLWTRAAAIPGVRVVRQDAGLPGVVTSGQVFLYDPDGRLRFSGGITAARGHAGDNDGESAIEAIVAGRRPAVTSTPVFGCRLQ